MTITTALSPAREQAFHSTQSAQSRRDGDKVKFSLPPVNDPSAQGGSDRPVSGLGSFLPIAVPIAAMNDIATATPLPNAGSGTAAGGPAGALGTTIAGAEHNQGNLLSGRLISRLFQGPN